MCIAGGPTQIFLLLVDAGITGGAKVWLFRELGLVKPSFSGITNWRPAHLNGIIRLLSKAKNPDNALCNLEKECGVANWLQSIEIPADFQPPDVPRRVTLQKLRLT